jgi:hypothetical protein
MNDESDSRPNFGPNINSKPKSELRPTTVYIAGPMTGYPNHNFPAFLRAAEVLRKNGYEVVCPAEINPDKPDYHIAFRKDMIEFLQRDCDYLVLLPGFVESKGAMFELQLAVMLGMPIYFFQPGGLICLNYLNKTPKPWKSTAKTPLNSPEPR